MTQELKLTIGYEELAMPCLGCYKQANKLGLTNQGPIYQPIHLIVSDTDAQGREFHPRFYCLSCSMIALEDLKGKLYLSKHTLLPKEDTHIYKLGKQDEDRYLSWKDLRR